VTIPVTLTNPSAFPITVNYTTTDGSAVAPSDYLAASGTLTFPAGTTSQSVLVAIKGDTTLEDYEYLTFSISAPAGGGSVPPILGNASRRIQILNDEKPSLTGTAPSGKEGSKIVFGATLVQRYYQPITVGYATSNGTAVAPGDYTPVSGSITFPAGTNGTQTVGVQTNFDFTTEVAETFNMTWTSASTKVATLVKKGTIKANNS
jgi:chitinase